MSQIRAKAILGGLLTLGLFTLMAGCGDSRNDIFDPDTGKHVASWYPLGHRNAAQQALGRCTECHGTDYQGGISGVSCRTCHINTDPTSLSCSECHAYPNVASGAHAAHFAVGSIGCTDCHSNTIGTPSHNSGSVDVLIDASFNSKSGAASYGAGQCSNISCHGGPRTQTGTQANTGQSTPVSSPTWTGGTISVDTQCTECHVYGILEYNSYRSGNSSNQFANGHIFHFYTKNELCTACHNTAVLATSHFVNLRTPALEGSAFATINANVNYNGRSCDPTCHGNETAWP